MSQLSEEWAEWADGARDSGREVATQIYELLRDAFNAGFRAGKRERKHQALGICWCRRSHTMDEAVSLNVQIGETEHVSSGS